MAILKYIYLSLGVILYILINYASYTHTQFEGELATKLLFSTISLVLLVGDFAVILFTKKILKREFKDFTPYVKFSLYAGVLIFPLISLYYS